MAGARLRQIDPRALVWGLSAVVASVAGGLLVGVSPMAALDVAIVLAAAVAIAMRPYLMLVAVLLLMAPLPQREVLPYLLLFGGIAAMVARVPRLPGKRVIVPLALFLLIAMPSLTLLPSPDEGQVDRYLHLSVVGTAYARTPSVELNEWLTLAAALVAFCLAAWTVRTERSVKNLVWLIVLSSVVPVANGLGELAAGPTYARVGTTLKSLRGPFPHPNYFAFYLMVVLTLAVVLFIESRSLARKAGVGLLIGLGTICLFFTYTRSAWIGFALALVAIGALRYRRLLVVAVLGLALAAFVAPGATRKAQQRFGDLTSQSEASDRNSWSWRVDQWSAMLPYGFDRPLAGQGWDSYSRLTVRKFGHSNLRYPTIQFPAVGVYSAVGFTAHNDYVKDFVELGAPGLVLWVLSLVGLAVVAARARRLRDISGVAVAVLAVVIAVMLVSASDNLQGYTVVLTYVFALCGGLAGVAAASAARTGSEPAPAAALPPHAEAPEAAAEDAESVAGVTTSDSRPDPGPAPASVTERVRVGLARFASRVRRPR